MNRRAFVSMVTAGAASTLVQGTAAAAQPAPTAKNVVLVHGLFADGSSWSEVIARLQAVTVRSAAKTVCSTSSSHCPGLAEGVRFRHVSGLKSAWCRNG